MESPTISAIEKIQNLVDQMKSDGIDAIFIQAALAQVMADLEPDVKKSIKG